MISQDITQDRRLMLSDVGKLLVQRTGPVRSLVIPPSQETPAQIGDEIYFYIEAANVVLLRGYGVNIRRPLSNANNDVSLTWRGYYKLVKVAPNDWLLEGDGAVQI